MKRKKIICLILAFSLAGCESMGQKTKTGAVTGGLIGATAGGIIGHQTGHDLAGAGIGAAVGALSGGLIGEQLDKLDRQSKADNPNHLAVTNIVDMASKGVPDSEIINEIQRTHSVYHLNSEIITYLKKNKVGDRVIDYMLSTAGNQ